MDFLFGHISTTALSLLVALLLDRLFGEPSVWHPLVGFGKWVDWCRSVLQLPVSATVCQQRLNGVLAWCLAVLPLVVAGCLLLWWLPDWLQFVVGTVVLYFTIGWQSLRQHAVAIAEPLRHGWLDDSREAVGRIVSRDTSELSEGEIAKAGIESVLENGSDAIFAPIFWFVLLGPIGALAYRLSNTLDAMWGYKTESLLHFGWCAARIDDVLNYLPARLVVLTYALCGKREPAMRCARQQGCRWKSPNAGPVMAAGAGALEVKLGGVAQYFGKKQQRPPLGEGREPTVADLDKAIWLVDKGVYLWAVVLCFLI